MMMVLIHDIQGDLSIYYVMFRHHHMQHYYVMFRHHHTHQHHSILQHSFTQHDHMYHCITRYIVFAILIIAISSSPPMHNRIVIISCFMYHYRPILSFMHLHLIQNHYCPIYHQDHMYYHHIKYDHCM